MIKRCTATLIWLLVLALALPAMAQDEGAGAGEEGAAAAEPTPADDGLPPEPPEPAAPSDADLETSKADVAPTTPLLTTGSTVHRVESTETWKDVVVIPRKPFLKRGRIELMPLFAITMNDIMIQHYALGAEINYFLTDILSIGVQGMYYFKDVSDQEFYTRYHFGRVPSLNKYLYTAVLNFAYVPIYGKFELFNKRIHHFEIFATAGVGISGTEVIPRDYRYEAFTNPVTLTFPVGLGGRFFINKWLALQVAFRSYIMLDKFEPSQRGGNPDPEIEREMAKDAAKTDIINNMMFNIGFCFYLPTEFKYTTFR